MASSTTASGRPRGTQPARRPRNRKALILAAASRAFAERGYHAVGMDDIAVAVGISGPALYRHFPSKYALFAQCARSMAQELLDDWAPAPPGVDLTDPQAARAHLDAILDSVTRATLRSRRTGGIYRWEGRYLEADDRRETGALFAEMIARVASVVSVLRPESGAADVDLVSAGTLSVVASVTAHRTSLPQRRTVTVIGDAAVRVATGDLPRSGDGVAAADLARPPATEPTTRRDQVLAAAVRLFHSVGFAEVTVEAIATEAGLTPSGFYRHFSSKSDVLLAACLLASDHLDATVTAAGVGGAPPELALERLSRAYVAHSFAHQELMSVYYADVASLPPADQARLLTLQRDHVGLWVSLLSAARPEIDAREARFLVHAALGVVTDLGRRTHWRDDAATRARIHAMATAALGTAAASERSP
ncbi:AcrR family transcriptional regulator [Mumia flava]|uniref:AcrR family transcriptional regulator n=1 Tax=Mumia flava TaxID=1348852 RepID=A0A0B2B7K8_9ACTN|nr:TetR/AcrR family transcriptional regulator [Mumia flava]PJJ57794.1 AcrR family transcriptional regulator [Mumia flava]